MTHAHDVPEIDPVDEMLAKLLHSYAAEKKERPKGDPALEIMWEGIELYARLHGIEKVTCIC